VLKLVETSSANHAGDTASRTKYACLSHCWGKVLLITTKTTNLEEMMHGIAFESFPKTFQHAMTTTLKLGISYIWIDSLCIIQDDSIDWEDQSKQMAAIYRNGHFTIAASRATGSTGGCFSQPEDRYRRDKIIANREDGTTFPLWIRRPIDHNTWPLLKRGWVFQERLLSRRIIHFANEEVVWECMERTTCECSRATTTWPASSRIDNKSQHHTSIANSSRADLADGWRGMVMSYTAMKLTYARDVFPALSGLVKSIELEKQSKYVGGLWLDSFAVDMLWRLVNNTNSIDSRPKQYLAPSWSWASVIGGITYNTIGGRTIDKTALKRVHVQVKKVVVTPTGTDEHGMLKSGTVELRGSIVPVEAYYEGQFTNYPYLRIGDEERISPMWDDPVIDGQFQGDVSSDIFLLKMATTTTRGRGLARFVQEDYEAELICLVLRRTDKIKQVFTRLGYVSRYWPEKEKWFRHADKEEVIQIV
jgi:hypothetical protein